MSWQEKLLGQLCDDGGGEVKTGPFGSQLHQSDYSPDGTPVVMPKDIVGGRVSPYTIARVSDEHVKRLCHHRLRVGDIIYGRRGDIGRCALITDNETGWLCGTGCLRISLGDADVEPKFLFYFLNHPATIGWIFNQAIGATMANLNTSILRSVPVRFPSRQSQQRIASILSAYDDLIENNTRRIAILEETARRLYEEWFVWFRFPGHEEAEERRPKDWREGTLKDVIVLQRGFDLPVKERKPGPFPVFAATGQHGTHIEAKVKGPGVLTGRSGSLGKVVYINTDFWPLNTTLWGKEFPLGSPAYAFYLLSSIDLRGFNSGSAVPTLNRNDIHGLPTLLPPSDLIVRFESVVQSMFDLTSKLEQKNANLRAQRDLLLPKLVSGEIDVSKAEEAMREVAA